MRQDSTWQDRAYYTVSVAPATVSAEYWKQIVSAGWTALSRVQSGDPAKKNQQFTSDFTKSATRAHLVVAQDSAQGATIALALTSIFTGPAPVLSTGVAGTPPSGATASASDRGARDPAGFPRLPGSVRVSFDVSAGAASPRELAYYSATCALASAEAFYVQTLPGTGWNEVMRWDNVDDVAKTEQVEMTWKNSNRSASIALAAGPKGGTSLRVTLVTDTTGVLTNAEMTKEYARHLAEELNSVGVPMSSTDLNDLEKALTEGGQAGVNVAESIATQITQAKAAAQPQNQADTNSPNTTIQLSHTQVDRMIVTLSTGNSSSLQISQFLKGKLLQLKQK